MRRTTAALLTILLAAACSSSSPKPSDSPAPGFPLEADEASLKMLDGRWEGEYYNVTQKRGGTIVFEFSGARATGNGDVMLIPKGMSEAVKPSRPPTEAETLAQMPRITSIQFVKAEGGNLSGKMDPFIDPECNCEVMATFYGKVTGDLIEGNFRTSAPGEGTWKAKRVPRRVE
ncbi:MAG TPA: hypothetical protein VIA29_11020 [Thermoanaerobaculia bacterium]|jgi:hypothetical protein